MFSFKKKSVLDSNSRSGAKGGAGDTTQLLDEKNQQIESLMEELHGIRREMVLYF